MKLEVGEIREVATGCDRLGNQRMLYLLAKRIAVLSNRFRKHANHLFKEERALNKHYNVLILAKYELKDLNTDQMRVRDLEIQNLQIEREDARLAFLEEEREIEVRPEELIELPKQIPKVGGKLGEMEPAQYDPNTLAMILPVLKKEEVNQHGQ